MRDAVTECVTQRFTDPVAVTKCVTQCFTESVTVADMCAGNGADRGRDVRSRKPVAVMDHANVDELRHAELRRGLRNRRITSDGRTVRRSELVVVRRSGGRRDRNSRTDLHCTGDWSGNAELPDVDRIGVFTVHGYTRRKG